jgi:hypothetical protein
MTIDAAEVQKQELLFVDIPADDENTSHVEIKQTFAQHALSALQLNGSKWLHPDLYWNSSITISGFDPRRSGGPHVPAPLEVKTCIFPILLRPYTNCR